MEHHSNTIDKIRIDKNFLHNNVSVDELNVGHYLTTSIFFVLNWNSGIYSIQFNTYEQLQNVVASDNDLLHK